VKGPKTADDAFCGYNAIAVFQISKRFDKPGIITKLMLKMVLRDSPHCVLFESRL
jgi:hypothetical protein